MKKNIDRKSWWMTGQCRCCGKPISFDATYCSSCAKKGEKSNRYNKGKSLIKHFCSDCGKEVSYNSSGRCHTCAAIQLHKEGRIATPECRKKMSKARTGKFGRLANNWIDGRSFEPYPLGWTKTFKEQIRHRDGYKCRECGCSEVENGRRLDVHHIDYDKDNLDPENLLSLCHCCHMKTNGNREYWLSHFMEMVWKI